MPISLLRRSTFVLLSLLLALGSRAAAQTMPAEERRLTVRVIDADSLAPIAGAEVSLEAARLKESTAIADENGTLELKLGPEVKSWFAVRVKSGTYTPLRYSKFGLVESPGELIFPMRQGRSIGGEIVDAQGQPVEGATVWLELKMNGLPEGFESGALNLSLTTDAKGQWSYAAAPTNASEIGVGAFHILRGGNEHALRSLRQIDGRAAFDELCAGTYRIALPPATVVRGTVTDESGAPVEGAQIQIGADMFSSAEPVLKTDAQGQYAIGLLKDADVVFTVTALKHAPQIQRYQGLPDQTPFDFKLGPAQTLRGKVIDKDGNPVAGASVMVYGWRDMRTLRTRLKCDASGEFVWEDAPPDEVMANVTARDFASIQDIRLIAGKPSVITLSRPGKFVGTVVDAQTNQPVADFKISRAVKRGNGFQFFTSHDTFDRDPARPGQFEAVLDESMSGFVFSVVAPGYAPAESGVLKSEAGDQSFTFKLQPAADLTGKVLDASGKPAAGAAIYLAQGRQYLPIKNGKFDRSGSDPQTTQADDAGVFSFPATKGFFKLVVVADSGFAEVTSDEFKVDVPIMLASWARVSGVARTASGPMANTVIRGQAVSRKRGSDSNSDGPTVAASFEAKTDGEGRFTVDQTAPGRYVMGRSISIREGQYTMESIETRARINLEAGKSAEVAFGGGGRNLKGSIQPPADTEKKQDATVRTVELLSNVVLPPPPKPPKPPQEMTEEDIKAFVESDEMKAFRKVEEAAQMNRFVSRTKVNVDGSFEFDDVPLGDYILRGEYVMGTSVSPSAEAIGFVSESIHVEAGETPLELKPAQVKLRHTLLRGQPAPAFEVPSLDGKSTIKLSDYKGKIVLLDFWATWCAPCVKALPHLKSLHERFKDDPRFVMIGMSLDQSKEKLEQFVEREKIGWTQVRLGTEMESKVTESYAVQGIPMIVLVDGEGRVVMKGSYSGEGLEATIERLLASIPRQ